MAITLVDIIKWFFVCLGAVGIYIIVILIIMYFITKIQNRRLRKKIPEKIKREVENAKKKKEIEKERARRIYGTGSTGPDRTDLANNRGRSEPSDWRDTEYGRITEEISDYREPAITERQRDIQIQPTKKPERTSRKLKKHRQDSEETWPSFD